jgi:type IV conjugative transfer system protein TraL
MSGHSSDFPQYMSSPTEVLWWELDQVAITMLSFTAALLQGGVLMWIGFLLVNFFYGKTKKNKPRGFMKHMIYMFGLSKLVNYPEYFEQEFHE